MKTYIFQSHYTKEQLIQRLNGIRSFSMKVSTRNNVVRIKKLALMQHLLQRSFVGKIIDTEEGTQLHGRFCYPRITSLILCIVGIFWLCVITNLLNRNLVFAKKLISIGILLAMEMGIVFFFTSAKKLFQRQESEVLEVLRQLTQKTIQ